MNGDPLRTAFEKLADDSAPGPDCAAPARIWAAVRGELAAAETRALLDHALRCPSCGMAWRLAREVAPEAGAAPRPWRWPHWTAVAAAVVAALLIPIGLHEWRAPAPPVYREQGLRIKPLVPEGQTLPRAEFRLRWSPGPPGTRYSVRVLRTDLGVVATADALEHEEYLVPAEALRDLPVGQLLYWRVEAHLPDGSHVISETYSVRLE